MSAIHLSWIDSWDKTKARILRGEFTEEQAARLVYQNKFRNTLSKRRQRNKAHVSGPKDDAKERVVFETTLVAETGQTRDDLSPLAKRVAGKVFFMVKERGYQPKEIWEQTSKRVTHFLATMGTSGTAMGTTQGLKQFNPKIYCVGAQPKDSFHGLEGLKHMPSSIVPGIYQESLLDEVSWLETESAYDMVERLGKEEGLVVGYSSGAAMVASLAMARCLKNGLIVAIFSDHGDRYFEL